MTDQNKKKVPATQVDADATPVRRRRQVTLKDGDAAKKNAPVVKLVVEEPDKKGDKPVKLQVTETRQRPPARQPRTVTIPQFNWAWIVGIALIAFILFLIFTRPGSTPVDTNGGDNRETSTNQNVSGECPSVDGISEDTVIRVNEEQFLQSLPSSTARAVRGIVVLTNQDATVVTDEIGCDTADNLWANVRVRTSSSNATGWVMIRSEGEWLFGYVTVPAPVTTEQATANNNTSGNNAEQSMRSIRVGSGTCQPVLQPADFQDARNTSFGGFWIYSNDNPGNMFVRSEPKVVGSNLNAAGNNIVGVLPVGEGVEVIAYSDGFHFACGSDMTYWNVRYHDRVLGLIDGWISEGANGTMYMMGAD